MPMPVWEEEPIILSGLRVSRRSDSNLHPSQWGIGSFHTGQRSSKSRGHYFSRYCTTHSSFCKAGFLNEISLAHRPHIPTGIRQPEYNVLCHRPPQARIEVFFDTTAQPPVRPDRSGPQFGTQGFLEGLGQLGDLLVNLLAAQRPLMVLVGQPQRDALSPFLDRSTAIRRHILNP